MTIYEKRNLKTKGIIMKKRFLKKLVTASIAAVTALSVFRGVPTFADDNDVATAKATGETSAKVAINKTLNIAEGITTPKATFRFTFTPQPGTSSNDAPYQMASNSESNKGFIPDRTVTYSEADRLASGQSSIKKDTGDIFAGVSYDHAGEYVYLVKETDKTYTPIKDKNDQDIDAVKYDTRTYKMHVIVKNKENSGTFISSVYFREENKPGAAKVAPSSNSNIFKYDLFENTYTKNGGKIDPTDPKHPNEPTKDITDNAKKSLTILKKVDGGTADRTKDFQFEITVKLPKTNETAVSPVTQITVHYGDKTENVDVATDKVTFTKTFTLKHGQEFAIANLPAGSRYTVKETGSKGYTATSKYTENGESKTKSDGTQAQDYTVENVLVGEKLNDNTFTNKFQDVTPTGLLIDNLPFILMIGLGLAGFVVLSKKRRQA